MTTVPSGLSTTPAIQCCPSWGQENTWCGQPQGSSQAGTQGRSHRAGISATLDRPRPWGGGLPRTMHIQQEGSKAPGPTFIALAFSDEKGASLVHRSQQLPLSILPADGPEEPSGKRQEWVSLRVGDTPRSILRCPSHSVQSDDS